MKHTVIIILCCCFCSSVYSQHIWKDSLKTTVHLNSFKQSKKVVRAEYGKVVMYFNQLDYLKAEVAKDTVIVTPKYLDDATVVHLLKKGKVKILRRSDSSIVKTITHHLQRYVRECEREFEFEDGETFFMQLEIIGIIDDLTPLWWPTDSSRQAKDSPVAAMNEFEYEEEQPIWGDKKGIKIVDYFPLAPSTYYVYTDHNSYGELDTNQCKTRNLQGQDIFYFAECYDKFGLFSVGTTMFGGGIYFYKNDSLFTIEVNYEKDIEEKELAECVLLLPSFMTPGDSIVVPFDYGTEKKIFTYLRNEDVEIENTIHRNCAKFKIIECWPGTNYLGYIWLQKDVGLIKWMRSTGKIDELKDVFIKE